MSDKRFQEHDKTEDLIESSGRTESVYYENSYTEQLYEEPYEEELDFIHKDGYVANNLQKKTSSPRKKKRRRKQRPFLKMFIFIIILAGTIIYMNTARFDIKNIEVVGNTRFTDKQIIEMMNMDKQENIFFMSICKYEKKVKNNSYIKECNIDRKLPNRIVVNVKERNILAAIIYNGRYALIDEDKIIVCIVKSPRITTRVFGTRASKVKISEKIVVKEEKLLNRSLEIIKSAKKQKIKLRSIVINKEDPILIRTSRYLSIVGPRTVILKHIRNGNIKEILNDLNIRKIKRGRLTITKDNYCVFSPQFI